MSDSEREGMSPTVVYIYSLALRFLLPALSGPVVALLLLPFVAFQSGPGQHFHGVDIVAFSFRMATHFSLAMLMLLIPLIVLGDFLGKKRIDWKELAQRSRGIDRRGLWSARKVWRFVEDCRRMKV